MTEQSLAGRGRHFKTRYETAKIFIFGNKIKIINKNFWQILKKFSFVKRKFFKLFRKLSTRPLINKIYSQVSIFTLMSVEAIVEHFVP